MCITKAIFNFAAKGVKNLSRASSGNCNEESEDIKRIKEEMMYHSGISTDRQNLRNDQRSIHGDIRKAYNKIVIDNV